MIFLEAVHRFPELHRMRFTLRSFPRAALTALAFTLFALPLAAQPSDSALLSAFRWRNIGPASMGGRVVDIESVEIGRAHV